MNMVGAQVFWIEMKNKLWPKKDSLSELQHMTCGVFLDIRKEFDSISHSTLTFLHVSAPGLLLFVWQATICLCFDSYHSSLLLIKSGVPQGSIYLALFSSLLINFNKITNLVSSFSMRLFYTQMIFSSYILYTIPVILPPYKH